MTRRDCNDLTRTTLVNRDLLRLFLCVTSYASGSPFQLFHTSVTSWVRVEALSGCGAVQARLSAVRLRRVARRSADQSACTADHLFRENRADFGRLRRLSIVPPPRRTDLCCSPAEQHEHTPVPRAVHVQALHRNEQVGAAMRLLNRALQGHSWYYATDRKHGQSLACVAEAVQVRIHAQCVALEQSNVF